MYYYYYYYYDNSLVCNMHCKYNGKRSRNTKCMENQFWIKAFLLLAAETNKTVHSVDAKHNKPHSTFNIDSTLNEWSKSESRIHILNRWRFVGLSVYSLRFCTWAIDFRSESSASTGHMSWWRKSEYMMRKIQISCFSVAKWIKQVLRGENSFRALAAGEAWQLRITVYVKVARFGKWHLQWKLCCREIYFVSWVPNRWNGRIEPISDRSDWQAHMNKSKYSISIHAIKSIKRLFQLKTMARPQLIV